jgi:hypothetical protein
MWFTDGLTGGFEMDIVIRGPSDKGLTSIRNALLPYASEYKKAEIVLYRQNSISIRIRVIDPSFQLTEKSERHSKIWKYLEKLPKSIQSDISMIVLLTPEETKRSLANLEFDDPSPSLIK